MPVQIPRIYPHSLQSCVLWSEASGGARAHASAHLGRVAADRLDHQAALLALALTQDLHEEQRA